MTGKKNGIGIKERLDVHQRVTDIVLELLQKGVAPWQSPVDMRWQWPRNFATGQLYHGINVFLLSAPRYASPWFLTFVQALQLGGNVRKGEKGSLVVKYGTYTQKDKGDQVQTDDEKSRGYLKAYTVFNACQIEGIEFPAAEHVPCPAEPHDAAEAIVRGMPDAPVIHEGRTTGAYYTPTLDVVEMPGREHFTNSEQFYQTLFHELTHATGHSKRLARPSLLENKGMNATSKTAQRTYCQEELTAEMGAAFLCAHAGMSSAQMVEDSAAYIQGWLEALQEPKNKHWVVRAASQAQKAADFILGALAEASAPD